MSMSDLSQNKSEKEKTALDIIKTWVSNSPSHGIRRVHVANSNAGRVFWTITFLIFTTLMCFFIYTVISKHITHPTKINLTVRQYQDPKYFPAVTFCNLNPLRDPKFFQTNTSQQSSSSVTRPPSNDSEYRKQFNEYMNKHLADNANRTRPTLVKPGYVLNDILIQCTFNGRLCHRNLTPFFHPNYGNCYTFDNDIHVRNEQQNDVPHFWTIDDNNNDNGYRLFLELFLHQNEYSSSLDDRAAFRVFIHRKHEIPILSQNSLFLAPTTYTKLVFSQRIISFYQKCRHNLTHTMRQMFGSLPIRYSQALCFKVCEFRFIKTHCNCTDALLLVFSQFFKRNEINTNNSCLLTDKCFTNHQRLKSIDYCPECLPECEFVHYTIQSSYASYPNLRSSAKVLERIEKYLNTSSTNYSNPSVCLNNRKGILLDDIVAVDITASPYATEILTESLMYTWVDVISSVGGQTGLWIGVSLISLVEVVELFFLLLCHFTRIIYDRSLNQWKVFYQRFVLGKRTTKL